MGKMHSCEPLKAKWRENRIYAFGSHQPLSRINIDCIHIGDSSIASASQARNLGAILILPWSWNHISNVIRSSALQLRNISRIRKYLSRDATEQIIHSYITSRLDNHNALLYGLPANQLSHCIASRKFKTLLLASSHPDLIFSRKFCHITPILKELHWLPVTQRIVFKLLMIVYIGI